MAKYSCFACVLRTCFAVAVLLFLSREVIQVGSENNTLTVAVIDAHLDILRGAIEKYGGSVEVSEIDDLRGHCTIKYIGPAPIANGIKAALKDKFPKLRSIDFVSE